MDGVDDLAFLAGSEPRVALLAALAGGDVLSKRALVDRCDAARVTVNRNLERLVDRGMVAEGDDGYRLTALGSSLASDFLSLVDTAGTADDLAPLLRRLPATLDLDARALADAEVTVSTETHPYAPAARHSETLETASRVRQLLPEVSAQSMEASADRVLSGDLEMEVVVGPDVAETLRTDLADRFAPLRARDNHDAFVNEDGVPSYFLGIVDGTVQIGVSDDDGIPRALAESDAEAVRAWAEATYESYRETATPLGDVG